jgi:hypothetical protein
VDCQLRIRPTRLGHPNHDSWAQYRAGDPASEEAAARWLAEVYAELAASWLERFNGLDGVRDELARTKRPWLAAVASVVLNEPETAQRYLDIALADARGFPVELITEWGRKNGLLVRSDRAG